MRMRLPIRRLFTLGCAVAVGVIGATVVASPASAHYSTLEGTPNCVTADSEYTVTWKIKSNYPGKSATYQIKNISATHLMPGASSGVQDTPSYDTAAVPVSQKIVVTQKVPGNAKSATLMVKAKWSDNYQEHSWRSMTVTFARACTGTPNPTASFSPECNGDVNVKLFNTGGTATAQFMINGTGPIPVPPGPDPVVRTITPSGPITVTAGGVPVGDSYSFQSPSGCAPVKVVPKFDCDNLIVSFDNPQGPASTYKVVVGSDTVTGSVGVGQSAETTPFRASAGTSAIVTVGNLAPDTIVWQPPATCATLPDTGSSITPVVSIGAALLAGGVGVIALLFMIRRRRTSASV
jgi:hypothetical protein